MSCKPLGPFKGFTLLSMPGTTLVIGCSEKEAGSSSPWPLLVKWKQESKEDNHLISLLREQPRKKEGNWTDLVP